MMRITLASAMGTCFGVQDAIDLALEPHFRNRLTVVGQLVHNPQVVERLRAHGVRIVERDQLHTITTEAVMITAHGAADSLKQELSARGFTVYDATCPLVLRLHKLARWLEGKGYRVVVIGQRDHVEVRGVIGNLRDAVVVGSAADFPLLAGATRMGVVSQTTSRQEVVSQLVEAMRALPGVEDLRLVDTICQPVKDRQKAIVDLLAADIDFGVVIGGRNSSNTHKLYEMIRARGIDAVHIEGENDLEPSWFTGRRHVGITAGTSTPQDVIEAVHTRMRSLA